VNLHEANEKNRIRANHPTWPGNTVSSSSPDDDLGTVTLALPYAGPTRIRFEGLPDHDQALSPLHGHP
jgi:hypothetical protein